MQWASSTTKATILSLYSWLASMLKYTGFEVMFSGLINTREKQPLATFFMTSLAVMLGFSNKLNRYAI